MDDWSASITPGNGWCSSDPDRGAELEVAPVPSARTAEHASSAVPDGTRLAMIDATGVPFVWTIGTNPISRFFVPFRSSHPGLAATAVKRWRLRLGSRSPSLLALNRVSGWLRPLAILRPTA